MKRLHTSTRRHTFIKLHLLLLLATFLYLFPAGLQAVTVPENEGTYRLNFSHGWNFIALPVSPVPADGTTPACAELFATVTDTPVWQWDSVEKRLLRADQEPVQALRPYWIYCDTDGTLDIKGVLTPVSARTQSMQAGWNMVATPSRSGRPDSESVTGIWYWDAAAQEYRAATDTLHHGRGYWVYSTQPSEIILGDPAGDADGDGLLDVWEGALGGNEMSADTDDDGVDDLTEFLLQTRIDDPDTDNDGLSDGVELALGTNPLSADTDNDGMPDGWEVRHGLNPLVDDADTDADQDGLTALQEFTLQTNPNNVDSDGDGMPDGWEHAHGLNPADPADADADADADGLSNLDEFLAMSDPRNPDTDGDGMPDGWESAHGLDLLSASADQDSDGDGLTDLEEYQLGLSPVTPDTDGDGMPDGWEHAHGLNPADPADGALDPDNDGLSNLEETMAGTSPNAHNTTLAFASDSTSIAETAGTIEIPVTLNAPAMEPVSVLVGISSPDTLLSAAASVEGLDSATQAVAVTIPAGAASAKVRVTPINNPAIDPPRTVVLTLRHPQNAMLTAPGSHGLVIHDALADSDDVDGDGLPDDWELQYFGNLDQGPNDDTDGDGYTNIQEFLTGMDPTAGYREDDDNTLNVRLLTPLAGSD